MIFRYCVVSFRLALLLLVGVVETSAQKAPSTKPFERFDGCVLTPDEWTDGDSFRVRLPDGRLETFRLYFVDTTKSRSRGKRSDEQAAYVGLTRGDAIRLGEEAKAFTAAALQRPVYDSDSLAQSLWTDALLMRVCSLQTETILPKLLVRNGLARIYGSRTPLPDGRDSRTYLATLRSLEQQAKSARLGGWRGGSSH